MRLVRVALLHAVAIQWLYTAAPCISLAACMAIVH